jgi:hypothetical protein
MTDYEDREYLNEVVPLVRDPLELSDYLREVGQLFFGQFLPAPMCEILRPWTPHGVDPVDLEDIDV